MQRYLFLLLVASLFTSTTVEPMGQLELLVQNVKDNHGKIWIGIYPSQEAFLDKSQARLIEVEVAQEKTHKIVVDGLTYGEYAVALFHDLNENDEMDFNWMGVPSEPFAFSRPAPSKWRLPEFDEVKIELSSTHRQVRTDLQTWWEQ